MPLRLMQVLTVLEIQLYLCCSLLWRKSGEAVEFYEAYNKPSSASTHGDAPDWTICLRVQSGREKWLMTVLGSAWREVTLCSCVRSIWSCGEPGPSHVTPLSQLSPLSAIQRSTYCTPDARQPRGPRRKSPLIFLPALNSVCLYC